jgi:hypothetical protein
MKSGVSRFLVLGAARGLVVGAVLGIGRGVAEWGNFGARLESLVVFGVVVGAVVLFRWRAKGRKAKGENER